MIQPMLYCFYCGKPVNKTTTTEEEYLEIFYCDHCDRFFTKGACIIGFFKTDNEYGEETIWDANM